VDRQTEERIARNDATFRDTNERIGQAAEAIGIDDGVLPFICECADLSCTDVVLLDREEYEAVRANPRWFLNAHGHQRAAGPAAEVVESYDRYLVVQKVGHAGEVVEALDPREAKAEEGRTA
jgi:hypothetical protein